MPFGVDARRLLPRSARGRAACVVAAFAVLSTSMAFRIGPGNAPDERAHVEYMLSLSRNMMPVWNWPAEPYSYEAIQPPLYYLPGSLVLRVTPSWSPRARLRALRLISAALHVGVLLLLWLMSLRLYKDPYAALAPVCALACLPMFSFIGATVTNDAAANLAGAGLLAFTVTRDAEHPTVPWRFGLLVGAALLCKFTVEGVALACAASLWLEKKVSTKGLLAAAGVALVACGWLYARNYRIYGDPIGFSRMDRFDPNRYPWSQTGRWALLYFQSFWGRFGQMTQPMPPAAYGAAMAVSFIAAFGWLRNWRELVVLPHRPMLLAAYGIALAQNVYHGFFLSYQPQARYSFVALAAWSVLLWDGLSAWKREFAPRKAGAARWSLAVPAGILVVCGWFSV